MHRRQLSLLDGGQPAAGVGSKDQADILNPDQILGAGGGEVATKTTGTVGERGYNV